MKTIEEKAKAYDEALEQAQKELAICCSMDCDAARQIFRLFPQLRESEDERIRKEIIDIVKAAPFDEEKDVLLAYLEKQEQKPISSCDIVPYIDDKIAALQDMWRKEKVAFDWDDMHEMIEDVARHFYQKEQKPILEVFGFKVGDAVRLKDGDGRKHIIKSFEEIEGIHGPNFYHVEFEDNSARDGIYPGEEYPNGYYTQMEKFEEEQKPAEWSDKDKNIFNLALDLIKHSDDCDGILDKDLAVKWFTELPSRFVPQPKQEWSDDDKQWLESIIREYEERLSVDKDHAAVIQVKIDLLKSLLPHWKPSEEQMRALGDYIDGEEISEYDMEEIVRLYNDLKKL